MAEHHQTQSATFPFILDGTGIHIDISASPQAAHIPDQSHVQGQTQMSPDNAVPAQASFIFHPFADASQQVYSNPLHQGSPVMHLSQEQTLTLDPAQLRTPSVGPSRVLTRRQARMAGTHPYGNAPQESHQQQRGQQLNESFGLFGADTNSPRPQTPSGFHAGAQLPGPRIGIPDLNIGQITIPSASDMSPQHPSTPASVTSSSAFSHYGFAQYAHSGHSRSGSSSTHPRSASPAVSIVSAATSLSSGSNSKPKSGRSRPPASSASADCISMASFASTPIDATPSKPKPKRRLQNRQRKEICQYFKEHPNSRQEDIAARWGVERSTVSKILKHKNRWLAVSDSDNQVMAKHRPPKFAEIEQMMEAWLIECRDSRTLISDAMIRAKARECARILSIPEDKFKASAGWVENYKHRANIKKGIWIGRPDPGVYTDDEDDYDGPYLHNLIELHSREEAFREMDERDRVESDALESSMNGPGVHLESPSVTLNGANEWPTPLDLTFGDASSTSCTIGLEMCTDNNVAGRSNTGPSLSTEGGLLQQHLAAAQAPWGGEGSSVVPSNAGGPPSVGAQEAKSAMEIILRFLQTQAPDFLKEQERNIITDIKHLIWVTAAGSVPTRTNSAPIAAAITATSTIGGTTGNVGAVGGSRTSVNAVLGGQSIAA